MMRGLMAFLLTLVIARASEPIVLSGRAMGTNWTVKFVQPAVPIERDCRRSV